MSIKSQTQGGSDIHDALMSTQRGPMYLMGSKKEKGMPLVSGEKAKSKEGFSSNVKAEMDAGKPQKQAVAIAYSQSGEHKSKSNHRHKEHR